MKNKNHDWERGYFCAVALLLRETQALGAANTDIQSLFRFGGDRRRADYEDIKTFQEHGLIPAPAQPN